jgi:energy-coupling factor transporter transmembrane protein EcfT
MNLAASMDSRGFGRKPETTRTITVLLRCLNAFALLAIAAASYLLLGAGDSRLAAWLLIAFAVVAVAVNLIVSAKLSVRTQVSKLKFKIADYLALIFATGLVLIAMV